MDQDAFRNLLASAPAPAQSSRVLGAHGTLKRGSFKQPHTKAATVSGPSSHASLVPRPRSTKPKQSGNNSKYLDRAQIRREGGDDEFKPVERLVESFEQRAREQGDDDETIAAQRAYLGGDATHAALFKGLDYSLLAARKAELAKEDAEKYNEELDKVLNAPVVGESTEDVVPSESSGRSREDIMNALKASRKRLHIDNDDVSKVDGVKKLKKVTPSDIHAGGLGSKFKSIAKPVPTSSHDAQGQPKKLRRKKIKKSRPEAATEDPTTTEASVIVTDSMPVETTQAPPPVSSAISVDAQPLKPVDRSPPQPASPLSKPTAPAHPDPAESEDEDIFAGVGDYDVGLGSDSEDGQEDDVDDSSKPPRPTVPSSSTDVNSDRPSSVSVVKKRSGWFDDDDEDNGATTAPQHILPPDENLAENHINDSEYDSDDNDNGETGPVTRLQPLSSSHLPSARSLLEADATASALAAKRARKAKWRAKQGLPTQEGAEEDDDEDGSRNAGKSEMDAAARDKADKKRLNRERQQLEAYMAKKGR